MLLESQRLIGYSLASTGREAKRYILVLALERVGRPARLRQDLSGKPGGALQHSGCQR
jgi:hypothetical protein